MKLITFLPNGQIGYSNAPALIPPLGLCLPTGQTIFEEPPTARTLSQMFSFTTAPILGMEITHQDEIYVFDGTNWLNSNTFVVSNTVLVSGPLKIKNNTNYDIGITW